MRPQPSRQRRGGWPGSLPLDAPAAIVLKEFRGTEADLLKVGVPAEQIEPLLQLFRANVDHLNELRAHAFCKKLGMVDIAPVLVAAGEGRA